MHTAESHGLGPCVWYSTVEAIDVSGSTIWMPADTYASRIISGGASVSGWRKAIPTRFVLPAQEIIFLILVNRLHRQQCTEWRYHLPAGKQNKLKIDILCLPPLSSPPPSPFPRFSPSVLSYAKLSVRRNSHSRHLGDR